MCVRVFMGWEGAERQGHSPFSIYLSLRGSFFCIPSQLVTRAVTLSVTSRCVTVRQLWSGMRPRTNNKSERERSAGERGSHRRPPPNRTQPLRPPHSFSYSRVQFSESYLGYYSNPYPHQRTPTSGQKNSRYQLGHSIGRRAKV